MLSTRLTSASWLGVSGAPHRSVMDALAGPQHHSVGFLSSRTGRVLPSRHVLAVDDGNALLAAGLAGLGVLCLPRYMAAPHLVRGELLPVLEDWQLEPLPLVVAYPPNRHVSTKLRVFIDWVVALMDRLASDPGASVG